MIWISSEYEYYALMNKQDVLKKAAAQAAIEFTLSRVCKSSIIGIGTGSTANHFIDLLAECHQNFLGTVASSKISENRLRTNGIKVLDPNDVSELRIYIDGADEINSELKVIKGGGGALTQEKIICAMAKEFLCIADDSKWVKRLGKFPLPIEVIPMARNKVARELVLMGANPIWRQKFLTDNGNDIIDAHGLWPIENPGALETEINQISGVVTNGIFAKNSPDTVFIASPNQITTHIRQDKT
jgi:ribose 5-phosphate isomerase A